MGKLSLECRGDAVEAALAAADCANAAEQHVADPARHPAWVREHRDVVGGGRGRGDIVTAWIQDRIHAMFLMGDGAPSSDMGLGTWEMIAAASTTEAAAERDAV